MGPARDCRGETVSHNVGLLGNRCRDTRPSLTFRLLFPFLLLLLPRPDVAWMLDVMKGIVRHDHAALGQHLRDEANIDLVHQARRMSVQGIIPGVLLKRCLLWPGTRNSFWSKVQGRESMHFQYEKKLWDDGAQGLKKIVENGNDLKVAMGLLRGLKVVQPLSTESGEQDQDFFCPSLVPPHNRRV